MDFSPRRLPWLLALVGAVHGGSAGQAERLRSTWYRPDNTGPILLAVLFGAALFLAGWIHKARRSAHRPNLPSAAATIMLCCGAFGVIPGVMFGPQTMLFAVDHIIVGLAIGGMALPSSLLLIHAHSPLNAPRAGSLFAGADRAEEALATFGAMMMLPWYRSTHPYAAALILFLATLPVLTVGLQAVILAKQTTVLAAAFPRVAAAPSGDTAIICDIGFGSDERRPTASPMSAYRSHNLRPTMACLGDVERGRNAARRVLGWCLSVSGAAAAQALWLLNVRA